MTAEKQIVVEYKRELSPPFNEWYEIWKTDEKNGEMLKKITLTNYSEEIMELRKMIVADPEVDYMFSLGQLKQVDEWYTKKTAPAVPVNEEQTKAEIAEEYVKRILSEYPIKTLEDTQEIFYYEKTTGLYIPGQRMIENLCQHELKIEATNHLVQEVLGRVKRLTYIQRKDHINRELIPLENGVYDIKKQTILDYDPKYFFTTKHPVYYDPMALCPNIQKFLFEISENDFEKVWLLENIAAYTLYRDLPIQNCFMLHGRGRNGKSVYLNLVEQMLGDENVANLPLQSLSTDKFSAAELHNKNANIYNDLASSELKETGLFKAITGDDSITVQKKYQNPFRFKNYAKLLFACNQIPESKDTSDGYHRRWIIVGFNYQVPANKVNHQLLRELTTREEKSGWLNILLNRLTGLLKEGSFTRETIEEKRKKYERNSNSTLSFIDERIDYDPQSKVEKKIVYDAYLLYCEVNNLPIRTDKSFWKTIHEHYGDKLYERRTKEPLTGERKRIVEGIHLLEGTELVVESTHFEEKTSDLLQKPLVKLQIEDNEAYRGLKTKMKQMIGEQGKEGITKDELMLAFSPSTQEEEEMFEEAIREMKKEGEIYEPRNGTLQKD